jgi:hypothetical protein
MAYTLITTGSANGTNPINVTNIPQTFRTLVFDVTFNADSTGAMGLRFNGETGSVYGNVMNGTWGTNRSTSSSSITLATSSQSSVVSRWVLKIPAYNQSTFHGVSWLWFAANGNGGLGSGVYNVSNQPITSMSFVPAGNANFAWELWGLS